MKYSDPPFGHGWLKTKTRQFFKELLSVNPNVEGIIVFVNDGDDSDPAARKPKTRDVIEGLLQDYYYRDIRDRFYVLEISQRDKLAMGSVKHGALAAGMRFALDKGADLVFYSDGDLSIPLGLCGLPVDSIVNKGNDLAFGSIRKKGRVAVNRRLKRKLGSFTFNWWVRSFHKPIRGIKDTQRSFKCFRKDALEKILPVRIISVDENGRLNITFESDFSYYFTGDIEWLGRARILGFKLDEIPIVWIDAPETTMLGWRDAPPMFINTYRVRDTLDRFRRKRSVFIGFEQAA